MFDKAYNANEGKKYCQDIISKIKMTLNVDSRTGKPLTGEYNNLTSIFSHEEGQNMYHLKKLSDELNQVTEITGRMQINGEKKTWLICNSLLLSNKIMYSEE